MVTKLPRAVREQQYAPASSDDEIALVTITRPGLDPIRIADKGLVRLSDDPLIEGVISNGESYERSIISTQRPDDDSTALPTIPLVIDNSKGLLAGLVDEDFASYSVDIIYVRKANPDAVAERFLGFLIKNVAATEAAVTLELSLDQIDQEPFPFVRFTPLTAGGLFH